MEFRVAFERAIELDPSNIDSQAALAVLQTTNPQNNHEMRAGIMTLGTLYKNEKNNPLILNHLANHFFLKAVRLRTFLFCKLQLDVCALFRCSMKTSIRRKC